MSLTKLLITIVLIAAVGGGIYYWYTNTQMPVQEQSAQIANPASVNCVNMGGTLEIRDEENGQAGYCHLPDGRVCEEWALFRDNTCNPPRQ